MVGASQGRQAGTWRASGPASNPGRVVFFEGADSVRPELSDLIDLRVLVRVSEGTRIGGPALVAWIQPIGCPIGSPQLLEPTETAAV